MSDFSSRTAPKRTLFMRTIYHTLELHSLHRLHKRSNICMFHNNDEALHKKPFLYNLHILYY